MYFEFVDFVIVSVMALILVLLGFRFANGMVDTERAAWIQGKHAAKSGACMEWHAPVNPGDAPWWVPCS
jgi:hypothetical protein